MLDTSLSLKGLDVFLDERAIKVGDSIPQKLYEGLSLSDYVIYVISKSSIESTWVQEELSVAKMRQLSGNGCHVLPILIEDIELPSNMIHIKYCDMIKWEDEQIFRQGVRALFEAMSVEVLYPKSFEIALILKNITYFNAIARDLLIFSGFADGAIDGDYHSPNHDNDWDGMGGAIYKYMDSSDDPMIYLPQFNSFLRQQCLEPRSEEINSIISMVSKVMGLMEEKSRHSYKNYERGNQLKDASYRLGDAIHILVNQSIGALSSSYFDRENLNHKALET